MASWRARATSLSICWSAAVMASAWPKFLSAGTASAASRAMMVSTTSISTRVKAVDGSRVEGRVTRHGSGTRSTAARLSTLDTRHSTSHSSLPAQNVVFVGARVGTASWDQFSRPARPTRPSHCRETGNCRLAVRVRIDQSIEPGFEFAPPGPDTALQTIKGIHGTGCRHSSPW